MESNAPRSKAEKEEARKERQRERLAAAEAEERARASRALRLRVAGVLAAAVVVLGGVFLIGRGGDSSSPGGAGEYAFEVGTPGPGEQAPEFALATTAGETFDLAGFRGKKVLLYFQEGIGCQPCWDQLTDIEPRLDEFKALGIEQIATITTDPPDLLEQKVADEGITTPVMTDPSVIVSRSYSGPDYRMAGMSPSFNGHSFLLIGADGVIEWRADYGGPSTGNTMYVPVENLLGDIKEGTSGGSS